MESERREQERRDTGLNDADIERLAAEFIAEDWTPDRYYRELNLIAFARALLAIAGKRAA